MRFPEVISPQITEAMTSLMNGVPIKTNSSEFIDVSTIALHHGWKQISEFSALKLKVSNSDLGIFVKWYAPCTCDYARHAFDALVELANIDFKHTILRPFTRLNDALLFPLATIIGKVPYGDIFDDKEQDIIEHILKTHRLQRLGPFFDKVDLGMIQDRDVVIDPFSDDEYSIFEFMQNKA